MNPTSLMTIITDCRKWELYLTSYLSKNYSNNMHRDFKKFL